MTPSFVAGAVTNAASSASASPVTVAFPAGLAVNDLMFLGESSNGGTFPSLTTPSGWTAMSPANVLWKVADAGDVSTGSVSLTYSTSNAVNRFVVTAWRGTDPAGPIRGSGSTTVFSGSPASSQTYPSVASAVAGDIVLRMCQFAHASSSGEINFTTATEDFDSSTVTNATFQRAIVAVAHQTQASSGSTGTTGSTSVLISDHTTALSGWGYSRTIILVPAPASPPSNTVAPAVTGTASVGSLLTSTTGTWTNTPTSYAYQWKNDGTNISGATVSTYTVQAGDAGHALTCVVTASNTAGAGTPATSNTITIAGPPVNTSIPVISDDGTPQTGETVTCSAGSWTNTPDSYAYAWFRGASPIGGATSSSYVLQVTDEGANITCRVTATNGGGSTPAFSAAIVPAVTAPLSNDSGLFYYSGGTGNTSPSASIGGGRGGTIPAGTLSAIFGPITGTVAQVGGALYAVVYVRNTHGSSTDQDTKLYVPLQPTNDGLVISAAVPAEAAGVEVPALASRTTAPEDVTWTQADNFDDAVEFGDLGPGVQRGIYLRLQVAAGTQTDETGDLGDFTVRVESQTS